MATSTPVLVQNALLLTPSQHTRPSVLPLSAIDSQTFLRFNVEYLLIYNLPSSSDPSTISSTFRAALSEILNLYYPLSGRLREKPDRSGLEVICRSQGALFVEAVSDFYTAANFDLPPRSVAEWRGLLSSVEDVLDGSPLLVVQLTWLKDGALAVGVGFNHCICDGTGSADFLNAFAELVVGRLDCAPELETTPVWDRHLLTPQPRLSQRHPPILSPEFQRVPDLCRFMSRFVDEPLVPTSVTFEKIQLTRLKSLGHSTRPLGEPTFTTFEFLAAHVWQSWARSLKFPPNQKLKLLFSINIRKRMKPNLPAGYYGNAFVLGCAQATAGELVEKKLSHVAGLVKKAKEKVGDEHVRQVVELASDLSMTPDWVGVLILTQWSRLGLEKVDFGMGRPVQVLPICCDRHCYLLPVFDKTDDVKVMVALPKSAVEKYEVLLRNVDM